MNDPIIETQQYADAHEVKFTDCGNGHIQLRANGNLVNYYPTSKRQTIWSPTLDRKEPYVSPEEAVLMCFEEPVKPMGPAAGARKIKQKMNRPSVPVAMAKTHGEVRHFYRGELPPWDVSLGEFRLMADSDQRRLDARELEDQALVLRAEAEVMGERVSR